MILVTGAAGKTGQAIIRALVRKNKAVRAFVRRPEQRAMVQNLGAQEVMVGDMAAEGVYLRATEGVQALYHICPNMHPAEIEMGQIAIAAAQAAGVTHFVYHSVLHPHTEKMPHHWCKLRVEELLFEAGLDFTILQPAAYMQNILANWADIVTQGVYRVPYALETRLGLVDVTDVAEVAARVLTEAAHQGAIYELAGPEVLTQTEVAQILSDGLGLPVAVEQIPLETWAAGAKTAGLGEYQVETLLKMFRYYERYGFWGSAQVLEWLLGRPPTGFREFVKQVVEGVRN